MMQLEQKVLLAMLFFCVNMSWSMFVQMMRTKSAQKIIFNVCEQAQYKMYYRQIHMCRSSRERYMVNRSIGDKTTLPLVYNPIVQRDIMFGSMIGAIGAISLAMYIAKKHDERMRAAYERDMFDKEMAILLRYKDDHTLPKYFVSYIEKHFIAMCEHSDGQEVLRAFACNLDGAMHLNYLADEHNAYLQRSVFGRSLLVELALNT